MTHTPHEAQQAAELAYPDPPDTGLWEHTLVRICREHFIAGWEAKAKSVQRVSVDGVINALIKCDPGSYAARYADYDGYGEPTGHELFCFDGRVWVSDLEAALAAQPTSEERQE
jgi:hypothetical protein